jgi:hypothetical protein
LQTTIPVLLRVVEECWLTPALLLLMGLVYSTQVRQNGQSVPQKLRIPQTILRESKHKGRYAVTPICPGVFFTHKAGSWLAVAELSV